MISTRLVVTSLLAFSLVACGQNSTDNDGDNGGRPSNGAGAEYTDVFFKTVEVQSPNTVIVGTGDLTLSNGNFSGDLTAYGDSKNFPNDTGSISGTYQEVGTQGDKQVYTADLTIDFDNGPDYTASGRFYTVAGQLFTEQPMVLSENGSQVGKFILAQDDNDDGGDDGDDGGNTPQPGNPVGDGNYSDTFFKTVEVVAPYNVIVGEGNLTLGGGQLSGSLQAYDDSGDFPNATGSISGTLQAGQADGARQSYTADLTIDFDGDVPDYTASGRVYTVNNSGEDAELFTEQPMVLSKDGSQVGKFILAEQDD